MIRNESNNIVIFGMFILLLKGIFGYPGIAVRIQTLPPLL